MALGERLRTSTQEGLDTARRVITSPEVRENLGRVFREVGGSALRGALGVSNPEASNPNSSPVLQARAAYELGMDIRNDPTGGEVSKLAALGAAKGVIDGTNPGVLRDLSHSVISAAAKPMAPNPEQSVAQ